jgi:pyrimidine operon attenuation protein/uracil phosphoribosyltransferase
MEASNIILTNTQIRQKLNRIAYQIAEHNFQQQKLIILGIADSGYYMASILEKECKALIEGEIILGKIKLDKKNPMDVPVEPDFAPELLAGAAVILVDDVLESGRTMAFAVKYVLNAPVSSLSVAVLLDRMHPKYPIRADYVGLTLSTTIEERIQVEITDEQIVAYLK